LEKDFGDCYDFSGNFLSRKDIYNYLGEGGEKAQKHAIKTWKTLITGEIF
jgi:hypothetical protein